VASLRASANDHKGSFCHNIQASESGGEPPGRWWGPGAQALGLEPGQLVERGPYDLLFGEHKAPDVTRLASRDTTADAATHAAADPEAHPAAKPPDLAPPFRDWASLNRTYLDPAFLDPSEIAPPDTEWPEPEWPDPSWHGFAPGAQDHCTFVLAVSPVLLERYPDKAASLWQVFPIGAERYHDPEPDLEAEP
jgi:hypothetical protein